MTRFTYSDELFSDLYKDVYGTRPNSAMHGRWDAMSPSAKQSLWIELTVQLDAEMAAERSKEEKCVDDFKAQVALVKEELECSDDLAVERLIGTEKFDNSQDVEHWVWKQGFLFTDFGRDLVDRITKSTFGEKQYA